jgi:hypothetical protein
MGDHRRERMSLKRLIIAIVVVAVLAAAVWFGWQVYKENTEPPFVVKKPNIYLYSVTPMAFNLSVDLNGRLTASIPEYPAGGWSGMVGPQGIDGGAVPYLFYEFNTSVKPVCESGWSVARGDFQTWCDEQLTALGLNASERADFYEYWERELPHTPYLNIYLQPAGVVENMSHLSVSPAPQSVLRLYFYVETSENAAAITAPVVAPFARQGFTLVEWGVIAGE